MLHDLAGWDGRAVPVKPDSHAPAFSNAWNALSELLEHEDPDASTSQVRRDTTVLCIFTSAVMWDGVHTGIVLNQPEIIPLLEGAADRLRMPATAEVMRQIRELVPTEILSSTDFEVRMSWYASSGEDQDFARLADLYDDVTDGPVWNEVTLAVVRAARDNPDMFFGPD